MATSGEQVLPVVRVAELPSDELAERWLVEQLWCAHSVGVIGGAPKCAKTWLGLDMALSVATGTPCLGKYAVPEPGPVLVYLAEDALRAVRERIEGMARHRGLDLDRGGDPRDHRACAPARSRSGPHAALGDSPGGFGPDCWCWIPWCDFTASTRITPATWPNCWRIFARCSGSLASRFCWCITRARTLRTVLPPAQGLRGSGDIHAFGDSNLYLRRTEQHLILSSEHRAAPASAPVYLELVATDAETTHLEVIADPDDASSARPRRASARSSGSRRGAHASEAA